MSPVHIYIPVGIALWLLGLLGLLLVKHMLRRIIAVNLMGSGVFMLLTAQASYSQPHDPVLHALVVTGLVVAVSATAFALRLASAEARYKHTWHQKQHRGQVRLKQRGNQGDKRE